MIFLVVLSGWCKRNYAINVKAILHIIWARGDSANHKLPQNNDKKIHWGLFVFDTAEHVCINIFTYSGTGGNFGDSQSSQPQTGNFASAWLPQPKASHSAGRALRHRRVFRPLRSTAGQIRNGPLCAYRKQPHYTGGPAIRLFASYSLSGTCGFRSGGIDFSYTTSTWTATRTQAQRGNSQLSKGRFVRQSTVETRRFSPNTACRIFAFCLSEQYRPGVASTGKKTALTTTVLGSKRDKTSLVDKYEKLRAKVLSGRIHTARDGLVVILQKGLAAWLEVCGSCRETTSTTKQSASIEQMLPDEEHGALIGLFTNMALNQIQEVMI